VILALVVTLVSCKELDPETGDLRPACVDQDSDPGREVSFARDIRPLMSGAVVGTKGCKACHYPTNLAGTRDGFLETGLDLETLGALRRGGRNTNAAIVVPGSPCGSAIVKKLQGTFGGARMPKGGPYWRPEQIQLVVDWIAEGARGEDAE
jgi:hypothetical protein